MKQSMQSLIETLHGVKSGYGHYRVSIDVNGQELSKVTTNMSAIDAAFDEYYDDEDNEGRFYESRQEAQEAIVTEILASFDEYYDLKSNQMRFVRTSYS